MPLGSGIELSFARHRQNGLPGSQLMLYQPKQHYAIFSSGPEASDTSKVKDAAI